MSSSYPRTDDLTTSVIEETTLGLDPWHKMRMGWVTPDLCNIDDLLGNPKGFYLGNRPVIIFAESRGFQESRVEQHPTDSLYDRDVTSFGEPPIPGVAVWYVRTDGSFPYPGLRSEASLRVADAMEFSVFAVSHQGTHVGDPTSAISRGAMGVAHDSAWKEGHCGSRWLTGSDVGVKLTIERESGDEFLLIVQLGLGLAASSSGRWLPPNWQKAGMTLARHWRPVISIGTVISIWSSVLPAPPPVRLRSRERRSYTFLTRETAGGVRFRSSRRSWVRRRRAGGPVWRGGGDGGLQRGRVGRTGGGHPGGMAWRRP